MDLGSGRNLCTSHILSNPSIKRFENCPVRGTSKAKTVCTFSNDQKMRTVSLFLTSYRPCSRPPGATTQTHPQTPPPGRGFSRPTASGILLMRPSKPTALMREMYSPDCQQYPQNRLHYLEQSVLLISLIVSTLLCTVICGRKRLLK